MEPNEMSGWTEEQLAVGLKSIHTRGGLYDLEDNHIILAVIDRLHTLSALQAKIDGMIERPTITVETAFGYPTLLVNGRFVNTSQDDKRMDCDEWNEWQMQCEKERLTTALGMDDAKEGGEG